MDQLSYRRHRFPPPIIQHAIWLYLRFTLSYRDVEELLAERGLEISYETVRRWVLKFGPGIARKLRRCRPRPRSSDRRATLEHVRRAAGGRQSQLFEPSIVLPSVATARRLIDDKPATTVKIGWAPARHCQLKQGCMLLRSVVRWLGAGKF